VRLVGCIVERHEQHRATVRRLTAAACAGHGAAGTGSAARAANGPARAARNCAARAANNGAARASAASRISGAARSRSVSACLGCASHVAHSAEASARGATFEL
jgi:hypothetical protein